MGVVNLLSYTWAFLILGVIGIAAVLTASFIQVKGRTGKIVSVANEVEVEIEVETESAVHGKGIIRADEDTRSNNQSSLSV